MRPHALGTRALRSGNRSDDALDMYMRGALMPGMGVHVERGRETQIESIVAGMGHEWDFS